MREFCKMAIEPVVAFSLIWIVCGCNGVTHKDRTEKARDRVADKFPTPEWFESGFIFVRTYREKDLLLRHVSLEEWSATDGSLAQLERRELGSATIYHFTGSDNRLIATDIEKWFESTEPIVDCGLQRVDRPLPFEFSWRGRSLSFGGASVSTRGPEVLNAVLAPGKSMTAVLSSDGFRDSIMSFLSAGGPTGNQYVEVFHQADGVRLGEPITLTDAPEMEQLSLCWAPKENYIIVSTLAFAHVYFVPVSSEVNRRPTQE